MCKRAPKEDECSSRFQEGITNSRNAASDRPSHKKTLVEKVDEKAQSGEPFKERLENEAALRKQLFHSTTPLNRDRGAYASRPTRTGPRLKAEARL